MALRRKVNKRVENSLKVKKQNGNGKEGKPRELRVNKDEVKSPKYRVPFNKGWTREVVYRKVTASKTCDIYYYSPKGKRCRSLPEIFPELNSGLTVDNFSFSRNPLGINNPSKEVIRGTAVRTKVSSQQKKPLPTSKNAKKVVAPSRVVNPRRKGAGRNAAAVVEKGRNRTSKAELSKNASPKKTNQTRKRKSPPESEKSSEPKATAGVARNLSTCTNRTSNRHRLSDSDDSYSDSDIEFVHISTTNNNSELTRTAIASSLSTLDVVDSKAVFPLDHSIINRNLFQCFHCEFDSGNKRLLRAHMSSHTRQFNKFSCNICGYRATNYKAQLAHLKIHTDIKPFECYHCDYKAKQLVQLRRHIEAHLGINRFACPKCEYRTNSSYTLKLHVQGHSAKPRFVCKHCDFRCARSSNMKTHQRVHSGVKNFACEYCSYRTKWRRDLKEHESIHTGFKPYHCSFCSYRCITAGGLRSHTRIHTGEKPFHCKYCDFETAHRSALRKHVAGHKGVFPFSCPYCTYKTQYQTNIKHHVMVHEDNKPESCPHCSFRCISITELNNHMRTHTGEKPYTCDLCSYRVGSLQSLKKHLMECDPARYKALKSARKKGVERLFSDEEETLDSVGSDLEGVSLDSLSLDGSISSFSSDEDMKIVSLAPKPVEKKKNIQRAPKTNEINKPNKTNNKTIGGGSQVERSLSKCEYSFFDDDIFIGEYAV